MWLSWKDWWKIALKILETQRDVLYKIIVSFSLIFLLNNETRHVGGNEILALDLKL